MAYQYYSDCLTSLIMIPFQNKMLKSMQRTYFDKCNVKTNLLSFDWPLAIFCLNHFCQSTVNSNLNVIAIAVCRFYLNIAIASQLMRAIKTLFRCWLNVYYQIFKRRLRINFDSTWLINKPF